MELFELKEKSQTFKERFFWSQFEHVQKIYEFPNGLLIVNKNEENVHEVLWATNSMTDLLMYLEQIKKDFTSFVFRYGNHFDELVENINVIQSQGYSYKDFHVGYRINLNEIDYTINHTLPILSLQHDEIHELMEFERSMFDSYHLTYHELAKLLEENHLIDVLKLEDKIVGFIIIVHHEQTSLIRNLGIDCSLRRQGHGENLLKYSLMRLKSMGRNNGMLWVDVNNQSAIQLYEKLGFIMDKNEAEIMFYT